MQLADHELSVFATFNYFQDKSDACREFVLALFQVFYFFYKLKLSLIKFSS